MSKDRYRLIEDAYAEGFASGEQNQMFQGSFFSGFGSPTPPRRPFRRPHG